MGLLERAMDLSSDLQERGSTKVVSYSIAGAPDHPDYPKSIINAFQKLIGFASGSIMLLDSEKRAFYPLVSTGSIFNISDETRINSELSVLQFDESRQIETAEFEDLFPDLTAVNSVEEIVILRIGTGNPPSAILVTTEWPADHQFKTEIQQLVDELQDGIENYRQEQTKRSETPFSKRLTVSGIEKATAVFLNMSDAIEAVSKSYSELDNTSEKVNNLMKRITGRMGRLYELKGERILIVFPGKRLTDHELYLHQLSASFGLAYSKLNRNPDFQAEFKLWPKDRAYIEKQLPS